MLGAAFRCSMCFAAVSAVPTLLAMNTRNERDCWEPPWRLVGAGRVSEAGVAGIIGRMLERIAP